MVKFNPLHPHYGSKKYEICSRKLPQKPDFQSNSSVLLQGSYRHKNLSTFEKDQSKIWKFKPSQNWFESYKVPLCYAKQGKDGCGISINFLKLYASDTYSHGHSLSYGYLISPIKMR